MPKNKKEYPIARNLPVADFFYQGKSHSHPVRRRILVIERTAKIIRGYELREGSTKRSFVDAPIKSYSRSRIARISDIDKRRVLYQKTPKSKRSQTTLRTMSLLDLVREGIWVKDQKTAKFCWGRPLCLSGRPYFLAICWKILPMFTLY